MSRFSFLKRIDRNNIPVLIAIIAIVITGGLIYANSNSSFTMPTIFGMSDSQIGQKAIDYINNNQLSSTPASLGSVSRESGLVKIKIKIGTSEFDSYATRDGKLLFPQVFDMSGAESNSENSDSTATSSQTLEEAEAAVNKSDSPMLEAYIVARCPYGLQMQRAIADAVINMPDLAQYVKILYMGSVSGNTITSMHGDEEAKENLRQICIREEQPAKYWNYVSCQMKAAGTENSCATSTGVDVAKLNACVSDTSRGVAYAQKDFDLNTKYNITGSPTLVLNGAVIDESPFGGRSSNGVKTMVCAGFNSKAGFCSTELNTAGAAVSFSEDYADAGSTTDANCE
jgi:hypothetical protein